VSTLSILILTKNEQDNIVDVIRNAFQCADEVIIIDSGSTDNTVKLAEKEGAAVCYRAWDNDFAAQRNFGLTQTAADWVLYLDADERMDDILCREIKNIVYKNEIGQYGFTRHMVFNEYRFKHGIFAPDIVYRMFHRKSVKWIGKVHERPVCEAPLKKLKGKVDHYTYKNWHQWFLKADQYTTIWAQERYQNKKHISLKNVVFHSFFGGVRAFFVKMAFLDGWMGVISCNQHAFYTMLKYVKLYELQVNHEKGEK